VEELPFSARISALDNLGRTNSYEIATLIAANPSADEVLATFQLLSLERRIEVKEKYDQLYETGLYDRVFTTTRTYSGFNAGGTVTETRTIRKELETLLMGSS
jgi:hypothetical protein